jgi:hypothetical protein
MRVARFEPVYGYGWRQGNTALVEPATLEIAVDSETDKEIRGVVRAPTDLKDMAATLTLRTQSEECRLGAKRGRSGYRVRGIAMKGLGPNNAFHSDGSRAVRENRR